MKKSTRKRGKPAPASPKPAINPVLAEWREKLFAQREKVRSAQAVADDMREGLSEAKADLDAESGALLSIIDAAPPGAGGFNFREPAPAANAVPDAAPTPAGRAEYSPCVDRWKYPDIDPKAPGRASIFEELASGARGRLVATIIVPDHFNAESQMKIARLMGHAPALWQALANTADGLLEDIEGVREFAEAYALLWTAGGERPYDFPTENSDLEMLRNHNAKGREGRAA